VPASQPKRAAEPGSEHDPIPKVETLEATGLIVIAILVLILTMVRFWHHIPWNAR